jgi:photosynthetic reaction center cytochrome c subunit
MKRLSFVLSSVATCLLSASLAAQAPAPAPAQGAAAPVPAKNLQVLPKDWTTAQVLPVMRTIAAALGTECGHCHVWTAPGAPGNDFPADVKPEKAKARVMLRMVMDINKTIGTEFPKLGKPANELVQVQCVTCHRGQIIPKQLVDIVADTAAQSNAAAAVAKYRDLRKEFYGTQSYDFSDATLFDAATRAIAANKFDDAILYAQTNLEFNPKSARSHQVMSQAYQRKGDMANAIAEMEKAAALDPAMQPALNNLKNPAAGRGAAPAGGGGAAGQGRGRGQ